MFQVELTPEAERDIQQNYEWWRDNRSPEQARRWYEQIFVEMQTLQHMPERCPKSSEAANICRSMCSKVRGSLHSFLRGSCSTLMASISIVTGLHKSE